MRLTVSWSRPRMIRLESPEKFTQPIQKTSERWEGETTA